MSSMRTSVIKAVEKFHNFHKDNADKGMSFCDRALQTLFRLIQAPISSVINKLLGGEIIEESPSITHLASCFVTSLVAVYVCPSWLLFAALFLTTFFCIAPTFKGEEGGRSTGNPTPRNDQDNFESVRS